MKIDLREMDVIEIAIPAVLSVLIAIMVLLLVLDNRQADVKIPDNDINKIGDYRNE